MKDQRQGTFAEGRRIGRIFMYLGLVLSGVLQTIEPSRLVISQVHRPYMVAIWAFCMAVSGFVCLCGALSDRWIGEFTAIPLLGSVLALYGGSAIASAHSMHSLTLLAYGLIVISFACGLGARWRDIQKLKMQADEHAQARKGERL